MNVTQLTRQLVLEEPQRVEDGAGGFSVAWAPVGTVWAEVKAGAGRERAGELVALSTVPYRITVRAAAVGAPSRPKPEQRFREGERLFSILAVAERDPGARYLTCFAHEEVPT